MAGHAALRYGVRVTVYCHKSEDWKEICSGSFYDAILRLAKRSGFQNVIRRPLGSSETFQHFRHFAVMKFKMADFSVFKANWHTKCCRGNAPVFLYFREIIVFIRCFHQVHKMNA